MKLKNTVPRAKWVRLGWLAGFALLLFVFGFFSGLVERWYAGGIYIGISVVLRTITGWIPFSLGDIGYFLFFTWLIIRLIRSIRRQRASWQGLGMLLLYKLLHLFLVVYIIFKLAWGFNYDRLGIAYQLGIDKRPYTKAEITLLTNQLIDKVNECRRQLSDTILPAPALNAVYSGAQAGYQAASLHFPFLKYTRRSVKASLYTGISDYMGFSGYYNPFSGEAQLRTDVPRVLVPFIACHEIAHQLGYASESEANFVGYLAASASADPYFRYSVYLDMFTYAQSEEIFVYSQDKDFHAFESVIKQNRARLDTLVKKDRREIKEFFFKRRNRVSPAVSGLYDQYLKMNRQSQGIRSYDEVIGWLIAYQRKYGKL
jgi:hypothetical protein